MISIVASNDLWPSPSLASNLFGIVLFAEATNQPVGIRCSSAGVITSHLEAAARAIADQVGVETLMYAPNGKGRASVFDRDNRIAGESTKVFAFFSPGREMEGGTGHVVETALSQGVDVEAWGLDGLGEPYLLGSHDEEPE